VSLSSSIRSLAELTAPTRDALDQMERNWSPDSPANIVAAATVARAFGNALTALSTSEIGAVGKFAEMVLTTGDETASTAIATGFLESLLAQASRGTIDFRSIAWMLGPESAKYCRAWDEFTGVKTDGL
jgi:hypothetical protein